MSSRRSAAPFRMVLIASVIVPVIVALIGSFVGRAPRSDATDIDAERVVIVGLPGVIWSDAIEADTPNLDRLVAEGATAALAPRSESTRPSIVRGYLTLGAGNRAAGSHNSGDAQLAFESDERAHLGQLTAGELLDTMVGKRREGKIVHVGVPELDARQRLEYHGAEVGALGEALANARVRRGVVSAADRSTEPIARETVRGSPVTAIVDHRGVVPDGEIRDLLVEDANRPFGVATDRERFVDAITSLMDDGARVVLADPGETLRADEFAPQATSDMAALHKRIALERADEILGDIAATLDEDDLLLVVAPNSHAYDDQEHLTAVVAWGGNVEPGVLLSATTRRPGMVTLTDVAPTVLDVLDIDRPRSMSGRAMRFESTRAIDRPAAHDELDAESVFRERLVPAVFYTFVGLFVLLSILVALVFMIRLPLTGPLVGLCYVVLAVPLATFVMSVVPFHRWGLLATHVVLWSIALVIAGTGWLVSGPRWTGAIPVLLATSAFIATDLMTGGHLLVNAVFGNSVLAAGRFYGIPNTGSALFFGATVLALAGIGEQTRMRRARLFFGVGLGLLLLLTGLPPFGADVGGLLTGIAAVAVIMIADRHQSGNGRVPWKVVAFAIGVAVALTLAVAYLDSLRPVADQTHFGRFGEALFGGDASAIQTVVRKATQSWASLGFSRFTYVVPLGIAALAVMLRSQGPLREVLPNYPLFRASFSGLLLAGVLGFALNDSGVAVPAMLLAQAVPLLVLLGVDHVRSRDTASRGAGTR